MKYVSWFNVISKILISCIGAIFTYCLTGDYFSEGDALQYLLHVLIIFACQILYDVLCVIRWRYCEIPKEIYNEQKNTIEEQASILNYRSLKIIVPESQISPLIKGEGKTFVFETKVLNTDNKIIMDLKANIIEITQYCFHPYYEEIASRSFSLRKLLEWRKGGDMISIRPEETNWMQLATLGVDKKKISFGKNKFFKKQFEQESIYWIKIKLQGRLDGETEFKTSYEEIEMYFNPQTGILDTYLNTQFKNIISPELFSCYWKNRPKRTEND